MRGLTYEEKREIQKLAEAARMAAHAGGNLAESIDVLALLVQRLAEALDRQDQ